MTRPAHHDGGRRFVNPWPTEPRTGRHLLLWGLQRLGRSLPPDPEPWQLPAAASEIRYPSVGPGEIRITWVGHATFLLQMEGWNVLTDPQWSARASPVRRLGPRRFVPPGVPFDALPPVDAVIVSHDHYDHLDAPTVRRIARTHPDAVWHTPLRYEPWLRRRGVRNIASMDWWNEATTTGRHGPITVTALPAQHWSSRSPFDRQRRLWASFALATERRRVYFGGDSGYFHLFARIGQAIGPVDAVLLPIGAYEPRWFMAPAHMNPEEAVRAYLDLGGTGLFVGMHWGTWRLTDEDPLEPPRRTAAAWRNQGLPADRLWIPRHGETRTLHD